MNLFFYYIFKNVLQIKSKFLIILIKKKLVEHKEKPNTKIIKKILKLLVLE